MSAPEHVRAFVALELEERLREGLGELQTRLRPRLGSIHLVRPEGIHLTLRFLGSTTPQQRDTMREVLSAAASACPPAEVSVSGLGTFPERGGPRVRGLGMEVPAAIHELQKACERAALRAGFDKEDRPFKAHLTLGRWRDRAARPELPEVDLGTTRVETLVLFKSELRPGGAIYTPLETFALGR